MNTLKELFQRLAALYLAFPFLLRKVQVNFNVHFGYALNGRQEKCYRMQKAIFSEK